jgi:hypothetical protein
MQAIVEGVEQVWADFLFSQGNAAESHRRNVETIQGLLEATSAWRTAMPNISSLVSSVATCLPKRMLDAARARADFGGAEAEKAAGNWKSDLRTNFKFQIKDMTPHVGSYE